jgi:hypothetical protein
MPRNLNNLELDRLDGPNYPSIQPQTEKTLATEVTSIKPTNDESQLNPTSSPNAEDILRLLKEKLDQLKEFDSLSGTTSVDPRQLASSKLVLSPEEAQILLQELDQKIATVRDKSNRLKNAVDKRQELSPTVVEFNPKTKLTLKRGMQRVFSYKANNITYDHYKAAIAARQELSKRTIESDSLTLESKV